MSLAAIIPPPLSLCVLSVAASRVIAHLTFLCRSSPLPFSIASRGEAVSLHLYACVWLCGAERFRPLVKYVLSRCVCGRASEHTHTHQQRKTVVFSVMFTLRIAGDVDGVKRNIEVSFPHRPSLQQVCTVAETILPLRERSDRRQWHRTWAAATQGSGDDTASTAASSRTPADACPRAAAPAVIYTVESLVYLNRATHEWEGLYSASQLTSGSQVYCFSPLQHRRVAVAMGRGSSSALPSPSSAFPVREEHVSEAESSSLQVRASLPPGTGVQQTRGDLDRPGVIPEPQQRLVWDCASGARGGVCQRRKGVDGDFSHADSASPLPMQASARNSSNMAHAIAAGLRRRRASPTFSSRSRRLSSLSPSSAAPLGASAWSGLSPTAGAAPRTVDRARSPSFHFTPTVSTPPQHAAVGRVRSTSLPTRKDCSSLAEAQSQKASPSRRHSTLSRLRDDGYTFLSDLQEGWSSLLLSGEGGCGNRYAHLGDRLALLFDVLVHLDPQEGGAGQRQYILLRDFYLLASCVTSPSAAAAAHPRQTYASMSIYGTSIPSTVMDITAELDARLHWTWDDVVRHADKDRDGCIAYGEWISFGIEHPEVIQLLCRAVHALLLREAASPGGRYADRRASPGAQTPLLAPSGHLFSHGISSVGHLGDRTRNSDAELFSSVLQCWRMHRGQTNDTDSDRSRVMRATEVHKRHAKRCEACRELQAELSEGCRGRVSAQANIAFALRH
ncbi:conserved hypothetical protein [Leishmania mexicana MHOM/GT/2001/U1103]|uniref:EF-hand domain-containing protein n=1 Tax=Leishmania mexicana (strain MHOM/GT/2001/U1103) TaxID=929439 RepID=E9AQP1_LEIMU|nr:conserved hypothetical protein [Leishmania mexicana MHOM/GT/2001/U1103]CBZ25260.1 conserved hypothetical protein [Leishmania mexicana MHOM/GT/2001/U1103]